MSRVSSNRPKGPRASRYRLIGNPFVTTPGRFATVPVQFGLRYTTGATRKYVSMFRPQTGRIGITESRYRSIFACFVSFQHHYLYQFKCRSDNAPHVFSVADAAYQDMLHHEQPQHILMSGETKSGKSLNYGKLIEHLLFLGEVSIKPPVFVLRVSSRPRV